MLSMGFACCSVVDSRVMLVSIDVIERPVPTARVWTRRDFYCIKCYEAQKPPSCK